MNLVVHYSEILKRGVQVKSTTFTVKPEQAGTPTVLPDWTKFLHLGKTIGDLFKWGLNLDTLFVESSILVMYSI
jgi:hypothetical protein